MQDLNFVYGLEVRVIDLESKILELERKLSEFNASERPRLMHDIPQGVLDRIAEGEHAVRAIRLHRLMTQKELGEACGIRPNHISAIERGMDFGLKTAKRIAGSLRVPIELIR